MKEFILVLSIWGSDGSTDHYIGQVAMQQPMTESQCVYMLGEEQWGASYENEHYHIKGHCFPKECAGETQCKGGTEVWRRLNHSSRQINLAWNYLSHLL